MATRERDYYELLGVARTASDAEIKKAFRQRARELHPDVSDAPDAEARFKQVAEAYEVLSNAQTRQLYDRYGHAGLRSGGFQPAGADFANLSDLFSAFFGGDDLFGSGGGGRARQARGADVAVELTIELAEAANGTKKQLRFERAVRCDTCGGDGSRPGTSPIVCQTCQGSGRLQQVSRSVFGEFVRSQACPRCSGAGRVVEDPCSDCDGAGRTLQERMLEVEIPEGIHDGQRIRITGEGHMGALGGHAGDVYVVVHVAEDARFERDGNDIFSTVNLTMTQAALGASITVPTLDGDVELQFEAGTQPGELRLLRGRGMPRLQAFGRGDHRVLVNVAVPRRLTDDQRRLLEQFEAGAGEDTYREDEGFFEKLKSALR